MARVCVLRFFSSVGGKDNHKQTGELLNNGPVIPAVGAGATEILAKMNDLMTKSFLSYTELKKQAQKDLESELYNDLESGQSQQNLSRFFHEVSAIKLEMDEISNLLLDLRALNEESKSALSAKVLRGIRDRMKSDSVSVLKKAVVVKAKLHSLDRENAATDEATAAQTRAAVTSGLRTKLNEMMKDFQALREKINSDRKEELRRKHFNSTGEEPSTETLEKMMMMASVSVSVSSLSRPGENKVEILEGKKKEEEYNYTDEDEDDNVRVVEIQRSLEKLHQIFLDMALMVEAQGEKVDEIEDNVVNGGRFVSGGTNSLYYANQMKKKNRKWVSWVLAIGVIILLVCLVSLLAS